VNKPLKSPSAESWLSWHPEMRITDARTEFSASGRTDFCKASYIFRWARYVRSATSGGIARKRTRSAPPAAGAVTDTLAREA